MPLQEITFFWIMTNDVLLSDYFTKILTIKIMWFSGHQLYILLLENQFSVRQFAQMIL